VTAARDYLAAVQQRADAATDCGYAIDGRGGFEEPCARHATSWRWYQDVGHEDCLMPACDLHENKGGVWMAQMHAALTAALDLADLHDETERYSGQPWGDVPVHELRSAITDALTGRNDQ
jgi:hypothetical protein